ncbi:MAG: GNAT family N-acetyltransferase [bacterium]
MIRLEPADRHAVVPLLDRVPFNVFMAKVVARGAVAGEVWVDRPGEPSSCYVRHKYGMAFLVGRSENCEYRAWVDARAANADGARHTRDMLQVYPDAWHEAMQPHVAAGTVNRWNRTNFRFDADRFLERFPSVPAKPAVVRARREQVARFAGSVIPVRFWDTVEDFVRHGVGFFATDRENPNRPASLAFSAYLDDSFLEVGVETAEAFRGKGYAQAACARVIHEALARGLEPVWSCKTENAGSYRLAERLGFVPLDPHPYYELPAPARH